MKFQSLVVKFSRNVIFLWFLTKIPLLAAILAKKLWHAPKFSSPFCNQAWLYSSFRTAMHTEQISARKQWRVIWPTVNTNGSKNLFVHVSAAQRATDYCCFLIADLICSWIIAFCLQIFHFYSTSNILQSISILLVEKTYFSYSLVFNLHIPLKPLRIFAKNFNTNCPSP